MACVRAGVSINTWAPSAPAALRANGKLWTPKGPRRTAAFLKPYWFESQWPLCFAGGAGRNGLTPERELTRLAGEIGLETDIVGNLLASDRDRKEVLEEEQFFRRLGVQGVPCFIFNGQFAVSGAEAPEVLADAIRQAASLPQTDDDAD